MKVLALSDEVSDMVYSRSIGDRFGDVDLVLSCGDLPQYYLEYVVSMLNVPLVYVPGNHDDDAFHVPGGMSADGKLINISGFWIMGLGGSRRYKPQGRHQYTENEMRWRVFKLLCRQQLRFRLARKQIDLFISHSPPLGIHDGADLAHKGFSSFHTLLKVARPRRMFHGHCHVKCNLIKTHSRLYETEIFNIVPCRVVQVMEER
jgi:hypothetical protein